MNCANSSNGMPAKMKIENDISFASIGSGI